jgi:methionyl-tRNA synthetase
MAGVFGADGLRYILLREVPFDKDGDISTQILVDRYNADLANELGNLFSRTLAMISKYLGGDVPEAPFNEKCELYGVLKDSVEAYTGHMERIELSRALGAFWPAVQAANRFIEEKAPWALARDETKKGELEAVFRELLAVLRTAGSVLFPFMPEKMGDMLGQLGSDGPSLAGLPPSVSGASGLSAPEPLFPRIQEKPEDIFKD